MEILVLSDLHLEFMVDEPDILDQEIAMYGAKLAPDQFDLVALCGDITTSEHARDHVTRLARHFAPKPVLHVCGNHEYYDSSLHETDNLLHELSKEIDNYHFLQRDVYTHPQSGQRFLGCTLWYPSSSLTVACLHNSLLPPDILPRGARTWSDFLMITDASRILTEARLCEDWLRLRLERNDIVLTHMLPHPKSVASPWVGSDTNAFFLHDQSGLIESVRPKLWCHGHTHDSCDYTIPHTPPTRVVCNPRDYHPIGPQADFSYNFTVTIPEDTDA